MKHYISIILAIFLISCQQPSTKVADQDRDYTFGTQNDSALYYVNKGYMYLLDYGQYTLSELAFRKALTFDSTFILGKCLLACRTQNLAERLKLEKEIINEAPHTAGDDRLLVDISLGFIKLYNANDQGIRLDSAFFSDFAKKAEDDYRIFLQHNPDVTYIKPEYIGFLTINHGAEVGLDSLAALTTPEEKALPFYTSYTAYLEMERGNYTLALALADSLKLIINNPDIPMPYALTGSIYARMDSLYTALDNLDKALELDSNDVGSERLRTEMHRKLFGLWDRWGDPEQEGRPRAW